MRLNLQLLKESIKDHRVRWATFCLIGFGFLVLYIATFPAIQKSSADYDKLISTLPKGVISAFNITTGPQTLIGYLASKHFGFTWPLMLIMLAVSYSSYAIAQGVQDKTITHLLAMPISRKELYLTRLVSGTIGIIFFVIISQVLVIPLAALFKYNLSNSDAVMIAILGLLFGLAVLGLGMLSSAIANDARKSTAAISGVLLISYVLYLIASLETNLDKLKYFSVFHYFNPGRVVTTGSLESSSLLFLLGTFIISTLIGLFYFRKKDIPI
ncbi:MAG: ABC transporter permease subunit [Candidatus Nomurabacteria bacterium]|nr:MAG: ABC transporter permease subunit [Candidatus Nomurabacteria bacterium]HRV75865.1 ABC transporter permease subunit [Candidatus Saccharimonadales bacterium]